MAGRLLALSFLGLFLGACAAGKAQTGTAGGGGDDTTTTSTTGTTTASTGGTGGTGGDTTSSGGGSPGGTGGTGTGGSTGGGGTGGAGGTGGSSTSAGGGGTGGTGGAPPTESAIVLAGKAGSVLAADYHPGQAWVTATLAGDASHRPAVALLGLDEGVGVVRSAAGGSLLFTKYGAGSFSPPLAIGMLATSMAAPSIAAWGGAAAVAYHKPDFKHYFALYQGPMSGWSPVAEPILANNVHSFGPSAPAIAIVQGDVVVAYAGDDGNLYDQRRVNGAWEPANGHGVTGTIDVSPAIIGLAAGPGEAMIAYVREADAQVMFTVRTGGAWSSPAPVPDALSNDPVALAERPGGGVVLAFRGTNSIIYTCLYTPAGNPPWSAPKSLGVTVAEPPAIAPGIGGHDAEMVFVASGQAQHVRMLAGDWGLPAVIADAPGAPPAIATFAP